VATNFHWGTDVVDIEGRHLPGLKASFLVRHAPTSGCVVEIGCGGGKMLRTLRSHHPSLQLFGCDVRPLDVATEAFTFQPLELTTSALPYADASMDCVSVMDVLEHVPAPAATLDEITRILKPGGRLVAFVPVEGELFSFYSFYRKLLGANLYAETKEHIQAFSHAALRALIAARLQIQTQQYAYHFLGHAMDASMYAATKIPSLGRLFWQENQYYTKAPSKGLPARALNGALSLANFVAYAESKQFANTRTFAAGTLIVAEKS
jgi:SAM-dependent methyltransferase